MKRFYAKLLCALFLSYLGWYLLGTLSGLPEQESQDHATLFALVTGLCLLTQRMTRKQKKAKA